MNTDITKAVQQRLSDLGWYSGKIDGDAGPATEKAIVDFKTASELNPRAFVGVVTLQALFDDAAIRAKKAEPAPVPLTAVAPWMAVAKQLEGTKEYAGAASNPTIMAWARYLRLSASYVNDGVAWCGLFVAYVMSTTMPGDKLPLNPLGARSWLSYGKSVEPGYGAILVFWRGSKKGWLGHVGFYVGEDADNYFVLGGNQSDSVSVTKIAKARLLGARAPANFNLQPKKVAMTSSGKVSTNEA